MQGGWVSWASAASRSHARHDDSTRARRREARLIGSFIRTGGYGPLHAPRADRRHLLRVGAAERHDVGENPLHVGRVWEADGTCQEVVGRDVVHCRLDVRPGEAASQLHEPRGQRRVRERSEVLLRVQLDDLAALVVRR
ncbi:hypothetical protein ACFPRL_25530 [Pseudoclavibacter helvolus]